MSANGSMKTAASGAVRAKADWPYHSTCMLFLKLRDVRRWARGPLRLVGVVVAPAAQHRGGGGDQAGDDREDEGGLETVPERARDQLGKERRARQRGVGV